VFADDSERAGTELRQAVEHGDAAQIAETITANIWPLFTHQYVAMIQAVSTLPAATVGAYPVLRLVHPLAPVLARSSGKPNDAAFERALQDRPPSEVDLLMLMQVIETRMSGDVTSALRYARRLEDRLRASISSSRDLGDGPAWFFKHQIGSTLLMAGDTAGALAHLRTALQLGELIGSADAVRSSYGRIALISAVRGNLSEAEATLRSARESEPSSPAFVAACDSTERAASAIIEIERWGDGVLRSMSQLDPIESVDVVWPFILLARGRYALARQLPSEALEAVNLANQSHRDDPSSVASEIATSVSVEAFLALDNSSAARDVLESGGGDGAAVELCRVRLAISENEIDYARLRANALGSRGALTPAERNELELLSGWIDLLEHGQMSIGRAENIARAAISGDNSRILTTVPLIVIEAVASRLDSQLAWTFSSRTRTLMYRPHQPVRPSLTDGQLRVLRALTPDGTIAEIAAALYLSPNTIKTQLRSVYRKLGVTSRSDAIAARGRYGLDVAGDTRDRAGASPDDAG
jgi:DNA-binding CsgD family transcriptional regulator